MVFRAIFMIVALSVFQSIGSVAAQSVGGKSGTAVYEAQPVLCGNCYYDDTTQEHYFTIECIAEDPLPGAQCEDCKAFNSCHGNRQPDECWVYHWMCGLALSTINEMKKAVQSENPSVALAAFVRNARSQVTISPDGYILVKACDGVGVAAATKLSSAILALVAPAAITATSNHGPISAAGQSGM